jgi:dimeric dUTPase (all-alpha-NTP-PPase superfamily)
MCDKFSVLCTLAELNVKQLREDTKLINDKLTEMFEMQTKLDTRIREERNIQKDISEWVIGTTIAMESEIDEIRREVNWKWWKNPEEIDVPALQGEVIDMWHFLLSLSRDVGLTPEMIHRIYMEKNAENHVRQDGASDKEGYEVK